MENLLSVRDLTIRFGGLTAVDSVNFDLGNAEILGLLGPNGAGKTTCFNMISGVYAPTSGEIFFNGVPTHGKKPHEMAALGLGRTFQIVHPFAGLSVADNVCVALGHHHYPRFFGVWKRWNTPAVYEEAHEILKTVGLGEQADRMAGTLPLGNLRRLEIARAMALKPKLLLLDESFSGLRSEEIKMIEELVLKIRDLGVSILLIEHNMKVAMALSDRIVVLDHGKKLAEGLPEEIAANPEVIEAYLGRKKENAA